MGARPRAVAARRHRGARRPQRGAHAPRRAAARPPARSCVSPGSCARSNSSAPAPSISFQSPSVQRAQRRPAAVEPAEQALRVERLARQRAPSQRGPQVAAGQRPPARRRPSRRRRWAARPPCPRGSLTTRPAATPGPRHDQRDAQRRLVEQQPVRRLAVLAERLAVVGQHRHQRVARRAPGRAQRVEHAADLRVREGDLAVVGPPAKRSRYGARRRVGRVRVVEVDPREEGPRSARARARRRAASATSFAGPLRALRRGPGVSCRPSSKVSKPAREAEGGRDGVGADERAGAVARALEPRGQRGVGVASVKSDVVAHAVHRRVLAGEDGGVRRAR